METRAHYILIGLFTVVLISGAMGFMLWLAKTGPLDDADLYDIVFSEPVTGLSIGSRVLYSGIPVGTVERISIDPENPQQVIARIRVEGSTPVREDTRAELILANVTGASEVQLLGSSLDSPPLVDKEGGIPEIIADPSQLSRLRDGFTQLLEEFSTLLENSNRILSEDNTKHLARSLENLSRFSGALAGQSSEVSQGLESLSLLSRNAERLLRENEKALAGGMRGLNEIGPALEELRRTMAALREVVQRLNQEPGDYLFRREPMREFQP